MISREPRTLGYYAASPWFQWATLFVITGLLVLRALAALDEASAQAERQVVQLTLRNMRTGMQLAMGEAMMRGRESEIVSWAGSNPLRWLGSLPKGYRGDCRPARGRGLHAGEWCFNPETGELLYWPRAGGDAMPLGRHDGAVCRWRVVTETAGAANGGLVGLRLDSASACVW